MSFLSWLKGRRKTMAGGAVVGVAAVAITTLAVAYDGNPTTEVDLNDGSVWLTNASLLAAGHYNDPSRQLDGSVRATSAEFDVRQQADDVLLLDEQSATVAPIDAATMSVSSSAQLMPNAVVELGGPVTAILDPGSGELFVVKTAAVSGFDRAEAKPVAKLGKGADVAVAHDGTVFAASPKKGTVVTLPVDQNGAVGEPEEQAVDALGSEVDIAAVGSVPVVLDRSSGVVLSPDGLREELPGGAAESARLQQTSADGDSAFVATATDLYEYPLAGGEPAVTSSGGEGIPAQPVWLNGCAYAAWAGSGAFLRDCEGEGNDASETLPDGGDTTDLVFRVNRDVIVLNDVANGYAWEVVDELRRVDNWEDLTPPEGEESEEEDDSTDETIEVQPPDRTEENQPPVAVDDDLGIRAGRSTVLNVLDNDSDPDGDILTVSLPDGGPRIGDVRTVQDGSSFQIEVPPDASGSASFTYEVDDGRGGTDQATVKVSIHGDGVNSEPEVKREPVVPIEVGGTVTYNLLQDWRDPDGDDVFLTAVEPLPGDGVDFTPDGEVTYRATSGTQGPHDIPVTVSDGEDSATGVLKLDIRPVGSTDPIANNDHVVVRAGETATVAPLANDVNPTAEQLRLTNVGEAAGATIVPDFANKSFTFRSDTVGTQYVEYLAAAGPSSATGYVRVDVVPDEDVDLPPVAVRDVALLPAGGEALVNALGNDEDPTGGVLVLQSVTVPDDVAGIGVSVLGHETIRVTDTGSLAEPVTVTYRVSNGAHSAEGEVVIMPIPAPTNIRPPVANDDEVVVRVGDVVTADVLDNDFHPNDDEMTVLPELVEPLPDPEQGEAFVSQDAVRFKAGDEPGTAYVTYEVEDSRGQRASALVTVNILERDDERNQAPRPEDIEARALAGTETQIPVPLDGLDPDGDSVELVGIDSAPTKGRIVSTEKDHLVYEAFDGSTGVDTFSYRVRDRLGAESTATIRVGIAEQEDANQAPYAETDSLYVRPGREVAVPVLENDSDPDGDQIGLVSEGVILPEDVPDLEAEVLGDRLMVTAPDEEMETSLQYTIADDKGAEAKGLLSVTVDEDVPLQAPIARDDTVLVEDVTDELTADVDVLANDEDPDGTVQALDVEAEGGRLVDDGVVRVEVGERRQILTYTITDEDGNEASAFIHVPAIRDLGPRLISTEGIEVRSGETVDVPLSEHVAVQGGGDVRITQADRVSAVHANGDPLVKDEGTLVYTSKQGYFGADAITFEATDGTGPDDPEGRTSTLTIPVTVRAPDNQPPTFTDGSLEVGAGDDAQSIDLAALTSDPDPGDLEGMSYRITGGQNDRIDTRIDGQTLVARADADAKGQEATLEVEIDDGSSEPVTGTVRVAVTATDRAMPVANTDRIDDAHQGEPIRVDVLENDFNPFPDEPLTIVDARVDAGTASIADDDSSVTVTPGADFHGTVTVMYRIQDATGDPDRQAQGRIELTVKGKPDAPTEVTGSQEMNRSAVISWRAPANNGEAITGYTVRSVSGPAVSQECPATTCTITGLSNGQDYRFVVTATNAVGESDESLASPVVTPDVKPERPNPPRITDFGDRSLDVRWAAPPNEGSPIESYTLSISPAAPDGTSQKELPAGTLSHTWTGLENGQNYTFSVQAKNGAKDPSDRSRESVAEFPAAPPDSPGKPTIASAQPVGSESQMTIRWGEVTGGATNGDAVSQYQVLRQGGGQGNSTYGVLSAPTTSQTVTVSTSTENYTYKVRAKNKAGWGAWSTASDPQRAATPPPPPTNVKASPANTGGAGGQVKVSWSPPSKLNGARPGEVDYIVTGYGGTTTTTGTSITLSGLDNGGSYKIQVRTRTAGTGFSYESGSAGVSNAVVPWGKPSAPSVGAAASGEQGLKYSATRPGSSNGRDLTAMQVKYSTNSSGNGGTSASPGGTSWSTTENVGYSTTKCVQARVKNSEGSWSSWSGLKCAKSNDKPKPTATTVKGAPHKVTSGANKCTHDSCAYMAVKVSDFPAGEYTITCHADGASDWGGGSYPVPANGTVETGCYYGHPGVKAWLTIHVPGQEDPVKATPLAWY